MFYVACIMLMENLMRDLILQIYQTVIMKEDRKWRTCSGTNMQIMLHPVLSIQAGDQVVFACGQVTWGNCTSNHNQYLPLKW